MVLGSLGFYDPEDWVFGSYSAPTNCKVINGEDFPFSINYGLFANTVITFLIVAVVLFFFVLRVNRFRTFDVPVREPAVPN